MKKLSFTEANKLFVFPNKFYIITCDIDLSVGNPEGVDANGKGLAYLDIGENSTIEFNGGRFLNGKINFHNCLISPNAICLEDYFINCNYVNIHEGQIKFDNFAKKYACRLNNKWCDFYGAAYNVRRTGNKSQRLGIQGSDIYVGFQYMQVDTTNGTFPVWASIINENEVTWVKADGTNPDA